MTKPFGMAELEARSGQRSATGNPMTTIRWPVQITLAPSTWTWSITKTTLMGATVDLTAKEFDVLSFLARHPGKTCTHQMILAAVLGNRVRRGGLMSASLAVRRFQAEARRRIRHAHTDRAGCGVQHQFGSGAHLMTPRAIGR